MALGKGPEAGKNTKYSPELQNLGRKRPKVVVGKKSHPRASHPQGFVWQKEVHGVESTAQLSLSLLGSQSQAPLASLPEEAARGHTIISAP